MNLISEAVSRGYHRKLLLAKKNSPHIFFGLGIAGFLGTTVMSSRATLKLPKKLEQMQENIQAVDEVTEKGHKKEMARVYIRGVGSIGRLYGPSILVGGLSVAALTGSHVTLTRRNGALSAAVYVVTKAFDDYRERVRDEYGTEKELDIYHAAYDRKVKDAEGKPDIVKVVNPNTFSGYTKIFDESNPNWKRDNEFNRMFVQAQQNYLDQLLRVRGHVFLNEAYDALGFDRTREGALVGWVISKDGPGDNYIDFGMYTGQDVQANGFVNGWERSIILDFNVDGVIFDKI